MSDVAAIVAVDERWAIGRGGGLLCHLPADLRHFKQLTLGHTVVMGRRTFESLPGGPLPGRENIVVSRQHDYAPAGVTVAHSLDEAIAAATMPEPVFIIGGAQLYAAAMPFVNRLYLTVIGLTEKTKEILGDRFLEIDYYHNILPWLKETVLPNCRVREEWLESAIKQYIDHLEGLFDIRDSRKGFRKKVQGKIANSIGCTKEMSRGEVYAKLNAYLHTLGELQNIVSNSMESMIKPVIERLQNTTLEVLDDLCPEEEIGFYNGIHNGFFQVFFKKWTTKVHFEWIPLNEKRLLSGIEYTLVLHVEQNDIQEHFNQVLCDSRLMTKATEVGLERDSKDNRVFYKTVISSKRSISDMTHEELADFLREVYKDVENIQVFVSEYILNK